MKIKVCIFLILQSVLMIAPNTKCWAQSDTTLNFIFLGDVFHIPGKDTSIQYNSFQTSISDFQDLDHREAPGTVLVLTSEQIQSMGTSDLMEILAQVPSIALGRDVDDAIGLGVRGLWAHEGKVLFMLNGIPLNELDFGTFALGNRLCLDNISRIEIMTGPGSAIYGGTAALGVINIITRSPGDSQGIRFNAESSVYAKGFSRNSASVSINNQIGKHSFLSFQGSYRNAVKTTFNSFDSDTISLRYADSTKTQDLNFYIGLARKNFRTQILYNEYNYQISDDTYSILMRSFAWDNEWKHTISEKFIGRTRLTYFNQLPWFNLNNTDTDLTATNTLEQKLNLSSKYDYRYNNRFNMSFGVQAYRQRGLIMHRSYTWMMSDGPEMYVNDLAGHIEMNYRSKWGIFKIGARAEANTLSPVLFAPRFAWNFVRGNFFAKALLSTAFKVPTIQNINLGPVDGGLKNEIIQTNELTIGYQSLKSASAQITFFNTQIQNPIVFVVDTISYDNYINRRMCGTNGVELKYFFKTKKLLVNAGASYYRPSKRTDMPEIMASSDMSYLGFSSFKATGSLQRELSKVFTIYVSLNFQNENESKMILSDSSEEIITNASTTLINMGIVMKSERADSIQGQVGVNNLLNTPLLVSSPYAGDLSSIPMLGRQLTFSIVYRLKS